MSTRLAAFSVTQRRHDGGRRRELLAARGTACLVGIDGGENDRTERDAVQFEEEHFTGDRAGAIERHQDKGADQGSRVRLVLAWGRFGCLISGASFRLL